MSAARSLGYELQVAQAIAVLTGRVLEVSVTLTNRGIAPFYADWPVRVMAVGIGGGEMAVPLPFLLRTLLPGTTQTASLTLDLATFPSGEMGLLLGIPNPLEGGRPVRFANRDDRPLRPGWLTLGAIRLP